MANQTTIGGDVFVAGALRSHELSIPPATVVNADVAADADIEPTKLRHQYQPTQEQESDTTAVAEDRVLHVVHGTVGSIVAFKAGSVVVCVGDATITVDLLKNGVSVLTAAIVLDNANSVRVVEAGNINTSALAAGDVLEVAVTVNAGTGTLGKGVFAYAVVYEDSQ